MQAQKIRREAREAVSHFKSHARFRSTRNACEMAAIGDTPNGASSRCLGRQSRRRAGRIGDRSDALSGSAARAATGKVCRKMRHPTSRPGVPGDLPPVPKRRKAPAIRRCVAPVRGLEPAVTANVIEGAPYRLAGVPFDGTNQAGPGVSDQLRETGGARSKKHPFRGALPGVRFPEAPFSLQ